MTKCLCIGSSSGSQDSNSKICKRVQNLAVIIIWKLSCYGPTTSAKLKSNDLFVERVLLLQEESSESVKQSAKAIIWRLGNEEAIRSEKADQQNSQDRIDDDQFTVTDEWDEAIPYDLLISCSNTISDKVLTTKVYNRLVSRNYQVYSEKLGKHRLELIKKAVEKRKPILACLYSS